MGEPRVSVLITAYNREEFVAAAIESVFESSYQDFELIVVDDASTDNTAAIAAAAIKHDERARLFVNETNLGDYPNRNRAASYARGEFLKYLDSDDAIYPRGLQIMVECMDRFPEAGVGLSVLPDPELALPVSLSPREAYRENFSRTDIFGRAPGSAIIRRSAFEAVGGFSGRRQVGDHELWLKIAARFPVVKMPAGLVWDRQHAGQQSNVDGALEKSAMHWEVQRAALAADDCPLDEVEVQQALAHTRSTHARYFWEFVRAGGLARAEKYRRLMSIPRSDVLGHIWKRFSA